MRLLALLMIGGSLMAALPDVVEEHFAAYQLERARAAYEYWDDINDTVERVERSMEGAIERRERADDDRTASTLRMVLRKMRKGEKLLYRGSASDTSAIAIPEEFPTMARRAIERYVRTWTDANEQWEEDNAEALEDYREQLAEFIQEAERAEVDDLVTALQEESASPEGGFEVISLPPARNWIDTRALGTVLRQVTADNGSMSGRAWERLPGEVIDVVADNGQRTPVPIELARGEMMIVIPHAKQTWSREEIEDNDDDDEPRHVQRGQVIRREADTQEVHHRAATYLGRGRNSDMAMAAEVSRPGERRKQRQLLRDDPVFRGPCTIELYCTNDDTEGTIRVKVLHIMK